MVFHKAHNSKGSRTEDAHPRHRFCAEDVTQSKINAHGYTAGNTVTSAAVQNFLKAQTGKTYTISGLYDQDRWEQLANGQKPTAAGGLDVPASGTLKIHVILSNFSSGTSSKPASNPSTGDPIMATAGIMVLAAAALVSILELRKRKMI